MSVVTQFPAAHDYDRELRFQAMFEAAAIGIGICHLDGRILEANAALSRMLGYSPQELTGTHAGDFFSQFHPENHRETGGEIVPDNGSQEKRLLVELMEGTRDAFEIEKRYQRQDGSEFWGHLAVSLARDGRRQPAFLIAMLVDATERKRVEEHLREAEKMEVIGRLAGGIAHDFNNLLTGILLYCDLLSAGLEKSSLVGHGATSLAGQSESTNARPSNHEASNHEASNGEASRIGPPESDGDARAFEARALWLHVEEVRM